ncbi:MAG: IclR family transcriptional regulator [Planctomycetota bacterium]
MNRTLDNGLELLIFLARSPQPHGVSELSQALELPPSHVHRLLQTLVAKGYVQQDRRRRYAIGVGALRLGQALLRDIPLRRLGLPVLHRLMRRTRWSAILSVPFEDAAVTLAHVAHGGKIRPTSETLGTVLGVTRSASGKMWLAMQEPEERERVIAGLVFGRDEPWADAEGYRSELERVRRLGYALKRPSGDRDQHGIAVPVVLEGEGVVALLGVSSGSSRTALDQQRIESLVAACRDAAEDLQKQLMETASCPPPPPPPPLHA